MSGEGFLIFIGLPFSVAVLGLLSWRIATSKGRSGWWALAGLWLLFGLLAVMLLSRRRGERTVSPASSCDPTKRSPGKWHSKIIRRPRAGWRSNSVLFLLELHISLIMWGWLGMGSFISAAVFRDLLVGNPVSINRVRTDSPLAYLAALVFCGFFAACGALYVFEIHPSLIDRSERDSRRRARPKRRVTPPPGP